MEALFLKLFAMGIVVVLYIFIECFREISTFQVTHYKIQSPKMVLQQEKKIVLLSDLHNYCYGRENQKLLNKIKEQKPDLILVAGDMLIGQEGASAEVAIHFMKELGKICDVYFANGNHEQRMKENPKRYGKIYEEYKEALLQGGIQILENEQAEILLENNKIKIYGVEIPMECYRKFQKVSMPSDFMEKTLGTVDAEMYNILIAHNPIFMSSYLKWGADLIVSGHLHGGVARIPFFRGVITPQGGLFPKYSGELTQEKTKKGVQSVVVSKGIGIHTIPIRFWNPAEVVVLHMKETK